MKIQNTIFSINIPEVLPVTSNRPSSVIATDKAIGTSQPPRIWISVNAIDYYTGKGKTLKDKIINTLPEIRFQAKVTASSETTKSELSAYIINGITDAEFGGEKLQVFYFMGVVELNKSYILEFMGEADLSLKEQFEPLFIAAWESLETGADEATCRAAIAQEDQLRSKEMEQFENEEEDNKVELPEEPLFEIPADGKDIVEIGGFKFDVLEAESSLEIPEYSKELLAKVSFTTNQLDKGREAGLVDTYSYIDEAETIGKFHIEFPALSVYNYGKPKGSYTIEGDKYMPLHSYLRKDGFEYGLDFFGTVHFDNEWVAFLGYFKKPYDDKPVFPVKIFKRFESVKQLNWSNYKFTSYEEALQTTPETVNYLMITNPTFSAFPESLLHFVNLKELSVVADWNVDTLALNQLPEEIGKLTQLRSFNINKSSIEKLPDSIGNLHKLEQFYLNTSRLKTIPEGFWHLPELKFLSLMKGKLTSLPDNIKLPKLESLDVSGNQLKTIPEAVCIQPKLKRLSLEDNPLESLPEKIRSIRNVELNLKDKKRLMDYVYKGANNSGVVKWKDAIFYSKSDKELIKEIDILIKKEKLTDHKKALRSLVKKALLFNNAGDEDYSEIGNQRFGGMPDLPLSIEYPEYYDDYTKNNYLYEFIGQINCETVASLQDYLPRTGTLFFFFETIHSLYGNNNSNNSCKIIYIADNSTLASGKRFSFNTDQYFEMLDPAYKAFKTDVRKGNSAPSFYAIHSNNYLLQGDASALQGEDQLMDDLYDSFTDPLDKDNAYNYAVNSYVFTQHESPELQAAMKLKGNAEDWIVLLNVKSVGDFQWGDAGDLFFVIHKSDLAKKDFSNVFVSLESS